MGSADGNLYFVAILPDQELLEEIQGIKEHVYKEYNSKAALNSPPHITLFMPFRWENKKLNGLEKTLKNIAAEHNAFQIQLHNYGAFQPRVIFIDVSYSELLWNLRNDLMRTFKKQLHLFDKGFEERPYHPHVTLAFRDLKKEMFRKAWGDEFSVKKFKSSFEAWQITLLKHNGRKWEVYKHFKLKE